MPLVETISQSIDLMLTNIQTVYLTILSETILYGALQFHGWWGKK